MSGAIGSILTNSGALAALNGIAAAQQSNTNYQTQLSTGLSINSPADNPAGYIEAQGFTSQLNGITQAMSNANEGISLLQTAQGAVNQQLSIAQKLNSIAVQAANGTQTAQESQSLQGVVNQLTKQISTVATQTQFNNINLLDGSFQGVQFQVGANEAQTINLSIGNTNASGLGMYTASAAASAASALYAPGSSGTFSSATAIGSTTSTPGTSNYNTASGNFKKSTSAATDIKIAGSNGSANVAVSNTYASASDIATAINNKTSTTNVSAQAITQATLKLAAGSGSYNFQVGNGNFSGGSGTVTNAVTVTADSISGVVASINANTAKTGISASLVPNTPDQITLTQSSGKNIAIVDKSTTKITQVNMPYDATAAAKHQFSINAASAGLMIQGKVSLQSDAAFAATNAGNIGLSSHSTLQKLSDINVSTVSGANQAINVVKYAIQGLNNLGGQLGASQQRLQATLNNLTTTSTNLNNGLATVQDANIPQVSQKLTQTQIQAQAGVAALKSSSTLQQAYLSLLP